MEKKAEAYAKYNNAAIVEIVSWHHAADGRRDREAVVFYRKGQYLRNQRCKRHKTEAEVSEISGNTAAVMQQVFDTMSEATV